MGRGKEHVIFGCGRDKVVEVQEIKIGNRP